VEKEKAGDGVEMEAMVKKGIDRSEKRIEVNDEKRRRKGND
jgi:hypothetical protein